MTTFMGQDGNQYYAGAYLEVAPNKSVFNDIKIGTTQRPYRGNSDSGYINFEHKQLSESYQIQNDPDSIPLKNGKINFPDYKPTSESQAELNAQKQSFETRLNNLMSNYEQMKETAENLLAHYVAVSGNYMYPQQYVENKIKTDPHIVAYNQRVDDINQWNQDFAEYVAGIGEAMIGACIPCSDIKNFLIDQFGDVLKDNFISVCEQLAEERKIPTTCCVQVCCDPCNYKLI